MKDRNNKFYIYQTQKIPYYIIIDPDKNEIEIYRLDAEGNYKLISLDADQPFFTFDFDKDSNCSAPVFLGNILE